ncbi:MAG: flavin reductase [Lachnospiraceae bacterium]|nr:flavin reductase [Lachnospiraceae bacterium]
MDQKILNKLTYGLFVITTNKDGHDNGCMTNTVVQLTSEPLKIGVALNKASLTCEMIADTKKFTVSILNENATFDIVKHFGFQSGRSVDKFANYVDCTRELNGTLAITAGTNAYISADVVKQVDLGSHFLFIASITDSGIFNDIPSATYAYYFSKIKPQTETQAETVEGQAMWKCKVCGYVYVGDEIPVDFVCPICKHPASYFEKVTN